MAWKNTKIFSEDQLEEMACTALQIDDTDHLDEDIRSKLKSACKVVSTSINNTLL